MTDERQRPAGFDVIDHTADVGLRVWGRCPEDLFFWAAHGLVSLLIDPSRVESKESRKAVIQANDTEETLVAILQEILYLYEVHKFVPRGVSIFRLPEGGFLILVFGEPFDPDRHEPLMDIKAATYHNLDIKPTRLEDGTERWECTIIFDT